MADHTGFSRKQQARLGQEEILSHIESYKPQHFDQMIETHQRIGMASMVYV